MSKIKRLYFKKLTLLSSTFEHLMIKYLVDIHIYICFKILKNDINVILNVNIHKSFTRTCMYIYIEAPSVSQSK